METYNLINDLVWSHRHSIVLIKLIVSLHVSNISVEMRNNWLYSYTFSHSFRSHFNGAPFYYKAAIFHMCETEGDNWINSQVLLPISSRYNLQWSNSCGLINEIVCHLIMTYGFKSIKCLLMSLAFVKLICVYNDTSKYTVTMSLQSHIPFIRILTRTLKLL